MSKEMSFMDRSFHRVHYQDMWSSYEACSYIVKDEWAQFRRGIEENSVLQF